MSALWLKRQLNCRRWSDGLCSDCGEDVSFQPSSEREEILQNVRTILATRKGSVPLDRDLGLSWEHLDKPYPVARSLMTAAVIEAVESYEPRVRVESVEFEGRNQKPWTA